MTTKLLQKFKQHIESLELEPSGGGCFEVTVDESLIYSKLKTGKFPNEASILGQIEQRPDT